MRKYAVFFTFKGETVAAMMDRPSDRFAAVSEVAKAVGGTLEAYYWMTGPHDGFAIVNGSDTGVPAAVSLAVASTGRFSHLETYELFPADTLNALLEKAKQVRALYKPPGQ
jgi:uncharacterized protein with GYD domain